MFSPQKEIIMQDGCFIPLFSVVPARLLYQLQAYKTWVYSKFAMLFCSIINVNSRNYLSFMFYTWSFEKKTFAPKH
jgi:hypothetical protein